MRFELNSFNVCYLFIKYVEIMSVFAFVKMRIEWVRTAVYAFTAAQKCLNVEI